MRAGFVYDVRAPSGRQQRRAAKVRRHTPPPSAAPTGQRTFLRVADRVQRLAYTRTQAAEALGISRSTFDRRILPFVEIIETPSGTLLVPVDELERLVVARRRPARARLEPATRGRPAVPSEVVRRIREEHAGGKSLGEIARGLDADHVPTAQGGRRWWRSSVRSVLVRPDRPGSARARR